MIEQDKRLYGGVAAAVLVAAIGGFSVAKCTTDTPPAATEAAAKPEGEKKAGDVDTLAMTAAAIKNAGVVIETINAGGLGAEIVSQAIVAPSPTGEVVPGQSSHPLSRVSAFCLRGRTKGYVMRNSIRLHRDQ